MKTKIVPRFRVKCLHNNLRQNPVVFSTFPSGVVFSTHISSEVRFPGVPVAGTGGIPGGKIMPGGGGMLAMGGGMKGGL